MSINTVNLCGFLVKTPEAKTVGEYQVARFSIAVDRTYGKNKATDFFDCEIWGKSAEFATKLSKGTKIAISGRIKQDIWESEGKKHSRVIVVAERLEAMTKDDSDVVKDDNFDDGEIKLSEIPF